MNNILAILPQVSDLPHINASLNSVATLLLVASLIAIKGKRERLHRNLMFAALAVSALFLACYLTYHFHVTSKRFPANDYAAGYAYFYYVILATHVVLAISVPFLAIWAMILGLKDRRAKHRSVVRWAFPIWLYVSVTGVLVYFMLYWWFVPLSQQPQPESATRLPEIGRNVNLDGTFVLN